MRKITIVMTYFDRQFQLNRTLESIAKTKHDNYEIIVVNDCSQAPCIENYESPIYGIDTHNKQWTNPEPAYNIGFIQALKGEPDIIIIQNAECYHVGDVLSYVEKNLTDENYLSFGCFSIDKESTFNRTLKLNNIGASHDGQNAWYNHPVYRPVAYDFCSAITTKNLIKLNGFDERLSLGCGRGDNYLLHRIKLMGLKVEIPTDPFVVHQWHYNTPVPGNKAELVEKNKVIYEELVKTNEIKAKHIFTPDLCEYSL